MKTGFSVRSSVFYSCRKELITHQLLVSHFIVKYFCDNSQIQHMHECFNDEYAKKRATKKTSFIRTTQVQLFVDKTNNRFECKMLYIGYLHSCRIKFYKKKHRMTMGKPTLIDTTQIGMEQCLSV